MVACDSPTLVEKYPFAACKDVYGDASSARLCPSNPDVRAYVAGLVEDLTLNYSPDAIDLAEVDFGRPEQFHPGRLNPDGTTWQATTLCLCESCRQTARDADVDVDALAGDLATNPGRVNSERLSGLLRMRDEPLEKLIAAAQTSARAECWIEIRDGRGLVSGVSRRADIDAITNGFLMARQSSEQDTINPIKVRKGVIISTGVDRAIPGDSATVVRVVTELAREGYRTFVFESYGLLPDERFDWLRQAIRFARRDSGG